MAKASEMREIAIEAIAFSLYPRRRADEWTIGMANTSPNCDSETVDKTVP
jgi:hypothetical protein